MHQYVAILDAGSQFSKLIDRKVRELLVEARIMPLDTVAAQLAADADLIGIIISGGPSSVYAVDAPTYDRELFSCGKPILGICYGAQMLAMHNGGKVEPLAAREDGQDAIDCEVATCPLFAGLAARELVLLTHGDCITNPGVGVRVTARSSGGIVAAIQHETLPQFGVQFHPEVDLSENGVAMLRNFLALCGASFSFTMVDREKVAIEFIRERAGDNNKVLCLASGGVDSTVCASLLLKALGPERVICIHINHGFMRKNESEAVCAALRDAGVAVHLIDATVDFANATTTITPKDGSSAYETVPLQVAIHPEEKRKIIGDQFVRVSDAAMKSLQLDPANLLLAQGTLRPDLIESGSHLASKKADAIKTHHNDTELVRELRRQGKIIEPLADYHKDEVRALGKSLGLPEHLVMRQPFPGPGLAIRVLCADVPYLTDDMAETEALVRTILDESNESPFVDCLRGAVKHLQLSAVLLPIRSVGVQGDGRTYAHALALTKPGAHPTFAEWSVLTTLAKVIPKLAKKINRVVFAFGTPITEGPRSVTKTTLTPEVLTRIREADAIVGDALIRHDLVRRLSQVPVVMVPVGFGDDSKHSIVIRTFLTNDFMTGVPAVPGGPYLRCEPLEEMVASLQQLDFVARVMFDLTAKPPGTTEWE